MHLALPALTGKGLPRHHPLGVWLASCAYNWKLPNGKWDFVFETPAGNWLSATGTSTAFSPLSHHNVILKRLPWHKELGDFQLSSSLICTLHEETGTYQQFSKTDLSFWKEKCRLVHQVKVSYIFLFQSVSQGNTQWYCAGCCGLNVQGRCTWRQVSSESVEGQRGGKCGKVTSMAGSSLLTPFHHLIAFTRSLSIL